MCEEGAECYLVLGIDSQYGVEVFQAPLPFRGSVVGGLSLWFGGRASLLVEFVSVHFFRVPIVVAYSVPSCERVA